MPFSLYFTPTFQALRQLPLDQAHRRFPTGEEGITGNCYFELSEAEIAGATANSVVYEVALDVDPLVRFRVELSVLKRGVFGASYFSRFRVSRRIVVKEQ
jgi:hypothetical protein